MSLELSPLVPSQNTRHFWHIAGIITLGFIGYGEKYKLETSWLKKQIPELSLRKCASYAITIITGSAIGGMVKYLRTGTDDGAMVGLVAGFVSSLVGSLLTEFNKDKKE